MLEDSPVATVILVAARKGINWSGKPLDLYQVLLKLAGKTAGCRWPKTVHAFGNELRRIALSFIRTEFPSIFERRRRDRIVTLTTEAVAESRPSNETPKS